MSVVERLDAAAMLAEEGQTVTLAYVAAPADYNPSTGEVTGTTPASVEVKGVFLPLSAFRKSQGNIVEGDQQLYLSALSIAGAVIDPPAVNGTVTDANGEDWTVISVDPLAPAGITIVYDCIARRAA